MGKITQHTVEISESIRLDQYLAKVQLATSRSEAARWIEEALVCVNGLVVVKTAHKLVSGDVLEIQKPDLKAWSLVAKQIDFEVLYEDSDLIVVNKPAHLVVHPGAGNYDHSLVHGLLFHCEGTLSGVGGVERPGIVHRLDKGTSGAMVVAKNDKAHQSLSEQFQKHSVDKIYHAITLGVFEKQEQTLIHLMKRSETNRKKFVINQKKGKEAVTHVKVMQKNSRVSFVEVKIDTGRTHQIRVHLNHIGHPILGDETYGGTKKLNGFDEAEKSWIRAIDRPLLHSRNLSFDHPKTKKRLKFEAVYPVEFEEALVKFLR